MFALSVEQRVRADAQLSFGDLCLGSLAFGLVAYGIANGRMF